MKKTPHCTQRVTKIIEAIEKRNNFEPLFHALLGIYTSFELKTTLSQPERTQIKAFLQKKYAKDLGKRTIEHMNAHDDKGKIYLELTSIAPGDWKIGSILVATGVCTIKNVDAKSGDLDFFDVTDDDLFESEEMQKEFLM